jgi:hypothetical protein
MRLNGTDTENGMHESNDGCRINLRGRNLPPESSYEPGLASGGWPCPMQQSPWYQMRFRPVDVLYIIDTVLVYLTIGKMVRRGKVYD